MIKRIGLFLVISIFLICAGAFAIYLINPYGLKTDNIRPRIFGIDIYRIPSKSMQSLLFPGDYILVSNLAYKDVLPMRKDIVVFYKPSADISKPKIPFIKRIIAVAGDTVQIKNGHLLVNNALIEENYVSENNKKTLYSNEMKLVTIPQKHVFVLGDNRDNSSDSRIFGNILKDVIIAKASKVLYGINQRSGNELK